MLSFIPVIESSIFHNFIETFSPSLSVSKNHQVMSSRDSFFFIKVRVGDRLAIRCNSKWFMTYLTLPDEIESKSNDLYIEHVDISDEGTYKCSCSMFICGEPRIKVFVLVLEDEGFLPATEYRLQHLPTTELIIPCRTREPATTLDVELRVEDTTLPAAELNYDSSIGFRFPFPHFGTYNFTCIWKTIHEQTFVVTVEDKEGSNKRRRAIRPESIATTYAQFEAETTQMAGRTGRALIITETPGKDHLISSGAETTDSEPMQFYKVPLDDETVRAAWFRLIIFAVVLTLTVTIIVIVISKYAICICQVLRKRKRMREPNDASIELMQVREERTA